MNNKLKGYEIESELFNGKGSKFIVELPATKLDEDAVEVTSNIKSIGNVYVLNIEFSDIYF